MFRATTPTRGRLAVLAAAAALTAASAGACRDVTAPEQDPATVTYAPALSIRIADFTRDTSGVYYRDVAVGSGTVATTGSTVSYFYTGYLADGRQFDTNANLSSPYTFVVGGGGVIRGFDRGVVGMHANSRRIIVIPPALGYGNTSQGTGIPAGSVLVFDVTVPAVTAPATTTTTSRAP